MEPCAREGAMSTVIRIADIGQKNVPAAASGLRDPGIGEQVAHTPAQSCGIRVALLLSRNDHS